MLGIRFIVYKSARRIGRGLDAIRKELSLQDK
jgi:hypothetical protein